MDSGSVGPGGSGGQDSGAGGGIDLETYDNVANGMVWNFVQDVVCGSCACLQID